MSFETRRQEAYGVQHSNLSSELPAALPIVSNLRTSSEKGRFTKNAHRGETPTVPTPDSFKIPRHR